MSRPYSLPFLTRSVSDIDSYGEAGGEVDYGSLFAYEDFRPLYDSD